MRSELVSTGVAAQAIGVSLATLARWWAKGLVTPELVTAGGQARWKIEALKTDLRRMAEHKEN